VAFETAILAFGIHQHEAGGVPQLVAEIAITLATAEIEVDIAAQRCQRGKREAQRIGAERRNAIGKFLAGGFFDAGSLLRIHQTGGTLGYQRIDIDAIDQIDRVERIALRLRHLLAAGIAYQAMHVHGLERYLPGEVSGHHDHAGDPEEDDVEAVTSTEEGR